MGPSATKATLKVLGLCALLLLLVAAATISVAVMVWHSEAAHQLKECLARAANDSDRLAELERDRTEQRKHMEKFAQQQRDLQRQVSQAKDSRRRLNATLMGCWENMTLLEANVTALRNAMVALQAEGTEMDSWNGKLQAEVARLEEKLKEATQNGEAMEAQREHCKAQQNAFQESEQGYLAEIASLQRRLGARSASARCRCPPFWYLLGGLASFCILFPPVSCEAVKRYGGYSLQASLVMEKS